MHSTACMRSEPARGSLPPLEPLEIHSGVILGRRRGPAPPPQPDLAGTPREVLEKLLLEALATPPCHVAFSGGRDSSAMLAVATHAARAQGVPDPIPLTARLDEHPGSWETEWQELVIRHLELREWDTVSITTELDALGSVATAALRRHGVYWPSQAHSLIVFSQRAGSGSLLTGGGGDELFSTWGGRRRRFSELAPLRPRRRAAKWMAYYALPRRLRSRVMRFRYPLRVPWLRPDAERDVARLLREGIRSQAPNWRGGVEGLLESRYLELVRAVLDMFASENGVRLFEPFYDSRFVRAYTRAAPPDGYASRAAALTAHFGDLLPPEVWTRGTKAVFTDAAWGPHARAFVESWDGSGLDESLVDPERLIEEWRKPNPDARSLTCLGQAWLAAQA
jgi:asparagine synthase (glutamine-hydrolysing)